MQLRKNKVLTTNKWAMRRHQPPVHPLTISFTEDALNKTFEKYWAQRSLTFVRVSLVLAVMLYISFAWLDPLIIPEVIREMMIIRISSCLFLYPLFQLPIQTGESGIFSH